MTIDLEALAALDMVVREGGFARAAQRLHKVQSAVSYQVAKLEQQLGVALLDRSGYRVSLTDAGAGILQEGRKLLQQAGQLQALAAQYRQGWEAHLLLIVDGILPLEKVLLALKALSAEGAPTKVQVKIEFLRGVQQRFEKENADMMIVKDFQQKPELHCRALDEIECILCVSPAHALAAQEQVSLSQLQEHTELTIQDSSDSGNDQHMFGSERAFFLSGFVAKKQALLMGMGYGWMPQFLVQEELAQGALREVKYEGGSRYRFTPQLVQARARPLGRAGQRLLELLGGL
ncbi:LysR family transcriptional regulator [Massilia sp. W12]|uniref:LysR family transcriptional regulator n=1 Tax=Massilia sp. W12 TaxID=3126507 RepID=UPI0030CE21D9